MKRQIAWVVLPWVWAAMAVAASAGDWPNWRGPLRNGVSEEKGLVSSWSKEGENLIWRADVTARATPIVFDGRVCVSGRSGAGATRREMAACFDAGTGKKLWQRDFNVYNTMVPFSRVGWAALAGDPETGYLYTQNVDGQIVCLDKAGQTVWQHRLGEEYGRGSGYGGRTLVPLVDEDRVVYGIVGAGWGDVGPPRQRYMAFDKRTGAVRWISSPAQVRFDDANNQSSPTVGVIGGRRLVIGGGADGWLYAVDSRTGEPVWRFHLSAKGLNSPPLVVGDVVYAAQSEENADSPVLGRVVAIDGKGQGDITKTGELWRADGLTVGFAAPTVADGRVYVVDNFGKLHALDQKTGKHLWEHPLGTIGRAAPVHADGKLFLTEQVGKVLIVQPSATTAKTLNVEELTVPDGRFAEIWGSVAVAYGRIYFTTEEGLYCLGKKESPFAVTPSKPATTPPATLAGAKAARLLIVPGEVIGKAGEPVAFEAWSFDASGNFLRKEKAAWSLEGVAGEITPEGELSATAGVTTAGKVKATVGELSATTQARFFGPFPWSFDFEAGAVPPHWLGAGPRFKVSEYQGGKRLHKHPMASGLQRANVIIGPPTLANYTVEADVLVTKQGRRAGDIGLINQGYTFDMLGKREELQLRTWAAELEKATTIPFPAELDVWYRMKLRVDAGPEKGTARGKIWKKDSPEPAEWTITLDDPIVIREGSPGLYGDSATDLYWDNISVKVSE